MTVWQSISWYGKRRNFKKVSELAYLDFVYHSRISSLSFKIWDRMLPCYHVHNLSICRLSPFYSNVEELACYVCEGVRCLRTEGAISSFPRWRVGCRYYWFTDCWGHWRNNETQDIQGQEANTNTSAWSSGAGEKISRGYGFFLPPHLPCDVSYGQLRTLGRGSWTEHLEEVVVLPHYNNWTEL